MRIILSLLSAGALLATPAISQARGFESDFSQAVTGPFKLEIIVSEDLAHRANNLPKKMSDRGSSSRLNSSFSNNGRYGDKEIEYLLTKIEDEVREDFAHRGIALSDTAPTLLRITIEEVKPNRPTFNQLKRDVSLSYESFGIGGAEISADLIAAGGDVLGQAEYDYFSSLNDHPFRSQSTWTDTRRAFSRFSKKLTKKLASAGAASS